MEWTVHPGAARGRVGIPGSKSHAVRGALFAAMAEGASRLDAVPDSGDIRAALSAARGLGATVVPVPDTADAWHIQGVGGIPRVAPGDGDRGAAIDVANSGTTLFFGLALAGLLDREDAVTFDGDAQIRCRSAGSLLEALKGLGARVACLPRPAGAVEGACPIRVGGRLRGGRVSMACPTSQYLSALMLACALADGPTDVEVPEVCEEPYLEMTRQWLLDVGARVACADDWSMVWTPGGQRWRGFQRRIPGDWSTAAFPMVAGALSEDGVVLDGLAPDDTQGDRRIVDILRAMGARVEVVTDGESPNENAVRHIVRGGDLRGVEVDLSSMPDALPALAVAGALASGTTRLVNVAHARRKETDRIAVMARELSALGARVRERPDGLELEGGALRGGRVHGHGDHRVVMALSVAGLYAKGPVTVDTAESAAVTVPDFAGMLRAMGARVDGPATGEDGSK